MSLVGFASLRTKHPDDNRVEAVEQVLTDLLRKYPKGILEDRRIADAVRLSPADVLIYFVELVEAGALQTRFFWQCPDEGGVAEEADNLADFPDEVECEQCGKVHYYDQKNIEVAFLPSQELVHSALATEA